MGVALGDLLQIIDHQTYLGEDLMNVYYYRYFSAPSVDNAIYGELLDDFQEVVVARIIPAQVVELVHTTTEIKNLSNGVDFAVLESGVTGQAPGGTGNGEPSFVTLSFAMLRDSLVTRNGAKRIGGIPDPWVEGNDWIGSPTIIGDIQNCISEPLHAGLLEVASPVIVKRPITPPVGSTYVYSSVTAGLFLRVGTQNTRKA